MAMGASRALWRAAARPSSRRRPSRRPGPTPPMRCGAAARRRRRTGRPCPPRSPGDASRCGTCSGRRARARPPGPATARTAPGARAGRGPGRQPLKSPMTDTAAALGAHSPTMRAGRHRAGRRAVVEAGVGALVEQPDVVVGEQAAGGSLGVVMARSRVPDRPRAAARQVAGQAVGLHRGQQVGDLGSAASSGRVTGRRSTQFGRSAPVPGTFWGSVWATRSSSATSTAGASLSARTSSVARSRLSSG